MTATESTMTAEEINELRLFHDPKDGWCACATPQPCVAHRLLVTLDMEVAWRRAITNTLRTTIVNFHEGLHSRAVPFVECDWPSCVKARDVLGDIPE